METLDSVDGLLEYQLTLTSADFEELVGVDAFARLNFLAAEAHAELQSPLRPAAAAAAASAAGIAASPHPLTEEPHEIFVRRYSAATRPWVGFHFDRSSLTMNVALSDDQGLEGGALLAIVGGEVVRCDRAEGTATLHASTLLHAVTRVQGPAARYSLILFYRQICPAAAHRLVECSVATMDLLYPPEEGSYSCDACGDSRRELEEQGCRSMWHCAAGCEYDLCGVCHDVGLADGVEYVSVR
mmetsp:Transcript_44116/g.143525  ORF Transcript_44116/g.143525 Transcript_44116/m.143525 type:complete len:242 (-) Transcript_44116:43-768(-)